MLSLHTKLTKIHTKILKSLKNRQPKRRNVEQPPSRNLWMILNVFRVLYSIYCFLLSRIDFCSILEFWSLFEFLRKNRDIEWGSYRFFVMVSIYQIIIIIIGEALEIDFASIFDIFAKVEACNIFKNMLKKHFLFVSNENI